MGYIRAWVVAAAVGIVMAMVKPAHASYRLTGVGLNSCGIWVEDRRSSSDLRAVVDSQWILGFLAGVGYAHSTTRIRSMV